MDNFNAFVITFDCNNYLKIKSNPKTETNAEKKLLSQSTTMANVLAKMTPQAESAAVCLGFNFLNERIIYNRREVATGASLRIQLTKTQR